MKQRVAKWKHSEHIPGYAKQLRAERFGQPGKRRYRWHPSVEVYFFRRYRTPEDALLALLRDRTMPAAEKRVKDVIVAEILGSTRTADGVLEASTALTNFERICRARFRRLEAEGIDVKGDNDHRELRALPGLWVFRRNLQAFANPRSFFTEIAPAFPPGYFNFPMGTALHDDAQKADRLIQCFRRFGYGAALNNSVLEALASLSDEMLAYVIRYVEGRRQRASARSQTWVG